MKRFFNWRVGLMLTALTLGIICSLQAAVPNLSGPFSISELYTSRQLPSAYVDGNVSVARGSRYGETATLPLVRKSHTLADEGTYFVVNNAQTGILENVATGYVATTPTLVIANTGSTVSASAPNIYLDYVDLVASAAGVTATAVSGKWQAVVVDTGNRYSSGGTNLSSKIVRPNLNYASGGSVANIYFGAVTATAATASARTIVGQRLFRLPVTATTAPDVIGDRFRLEFGSVESEPPVQIGTTGALMANAYQSTAKIPPIVIGPGQCALIYTWTACTTYSTATTWLPEIGWWER
jgi:hypothetical protein